MLCIRTDQAVSLSPDDFFIKQYDLCFNRYILWHSSNNGGHLHHNGQRDECQPGFDRRSGFIRGVRRGPVFTCFHKCIACRSGDGYGYLSEYPSYGALCIGTFYPDMFHLPDDRFPLFPYRGEDRSGRNLFKSLCIALGSLASCSGNPVVLCMSGERQDRYGCKHHVCCSFVPVPAEDVSG